MRLIDADELKTDIEVQVAFIGLLSSELASVGEEVKKGFFDTIDRQKTKDAVPVVRCKDCRHFILTSDYLSQPYYDCAFQNGMGYIVSPDDYCAWGERKDDR